MSHTTEAVLIGVLGLGPPTLIAKWVETVTEISVW